MPLSEPTSSTPVQLFYIRATETGSDLNMDLIVEATSPAHAVILWDLHYELKGDLTPKWVGVIQPTGKPGAIDWATINPE